MYHKMAEPGSSLGTRVKPAIGGEGTSEVLLGTSNLIPSMQLHYEKGLNI